MRRILIAVLVVAGCATTPPVQPDAGWKTFRARGPYTIRIPAEMVEIATTPIDSAADILTMNETRVILDYGQYGCGVLHRNPGERHAISRTRVDGRPAEIDRYTAVPNEIGEFVHHLRVQIPDLDARRSCLAIDAHCRTARDCDIARAMVDTIDFDPPG